MKSRKKIGEFIQTGLQEPNTIEVTETIGCILDRCADHPDFYEANILGLALIGAVGITSAYRLVQEKNTEQAIFKKIKDLLEFSDEEEIYEFLEAVKGRTAEEVASEYINAKLEFPFAEITEINEETIFYPNKEDLITQCPEVDPEWIHFARKVDLGFFSDEQLSSLSFMGNDEEEAQKKVNFILGVLSDDEFNREVKWKIIGWLLSLVLSEVPNLTEDTAFLN